MIKLCEYCGREFEAYGNAKYCCVECKAEGAHESLKNWYIKTDYNAKRYAKRNGLDYEAPEEPPQIEKSHERGTLAERTAKRFAAARAAADMARAELEARADQGDALALMTKLKREKPNSVDYWRAFQSYEIDHAELCSRTSTTIVNNISVYEEYFAELVTESIKELKSVVISAGGNVTARPARQSKGKYL